MRNKHFSNTLFYLTVVGLYIYQPLFGALSQIGLGMFQIVVALNLMETIKKDNMVGRKTLKIYLYTLLVWFIVFIIFIVTDIFKPYALAILYIIPMIIGLYFTVVTYLIYKNQKS